MTIDIKKLEEERANAELAGFSDPTECKKCGSSIREGETRCDCRPWLCYHCCECGMDCDNCNCAHKK